MIWGICSKVIKGRYVDKPTLRVSMTRVKFSSKIWNSLEKVAKKSRWYGTEPWNYELDSEPLALRRCGCSLWKEIVYLHYGERPKFSNFEQSFEALTEPLEQISFLLCIYLGHHDVSGPLIAGTVFRCKSNVDLDVLADLAIQNPKVPLLIWQVFSLFLLYVLIL